MKRLTTEVAALLLGATMTGCGLSVSPQDTADYDRWLRGHRQVQNVEISVHKEEIGSFMDAVVTLRPSLSDADVLAVIKDVTADRERRRIEVLTVNFDGVSCQIYRDRDGSRCVAARKVVATIGAKTTVDVEYQHLRFTSPELAVDDLARRVSDPNGPLAQPQGEVIDAFVIGREGPGERAQVPVSPVEEVRRRGPRG